MTSYFVRIKDKSEYDRAVDLLKSKYEKKPVNFNEYKDGITEVAWSNGSGVHCFSNYDQYFRYYGSIETELFLEENKEETPIMTISQHHFKVGDKVRCIDNSCSDNQLIEGKIYTVESVDAEGYTEKVGLVGEGIVWFTWRFELVTTPKEDSAISTLKSLTQSDKVFISFEKGKMMVVDSKYQVDYPVNSLEEAEKVVALIEKSATYEDKITEIDRQLEEFKGE